MKLLNRTLRGFILYAILVLLVVTPVLYLLINDMIIRQVDETLQVHKREIQSRLEKLPTEKDIRQWEDLDGEVVVQPQVGPFREDSIYTLDVEKEKRSKGYFRQSRGRRSGNYSHNPEDELYRVLATSVMIKGKPYKLEARISLVESEDLVRTLGVSMFMVLLVLLIGMVIINWWNSKTVWSPFYAVLEKLKSFEIEQNKPINLNSSSIKEFNDLNAAIEELTRRDYQAFIAQREFTENAAHEMQTPLAVFQSKVDLLLQTHPTEEQAALFESLLDATSRLKNLNKALLLLARIDNQQFPEIENINLHETTERLVKMNESETSSLNKKILIEVRSTSQVVLNHSLLEILLSNLISNAVRHSEAGSTITIFLDKNLWAIRNSGEPLSIPSNKIFERFRKNTSNQSSLGLGLSIVRKICDTNNIQISYAYEDKEHVFTLRFFESKVSPKLES